jgi:hypothetical protein
MILEYEERCLAQIDSAVVSASDDELFAGGYLRGHISLATAACEADDVDCLDELKRRIQQSLDDARSELSPADSAIVNNLWQELKN